MEAGLKKKISQFIILGKFWSKIWSGGVGTSDPSSFRKSVVGSWEKILS